MKKKKQDTLLENVSKQKTLDPEDLRIVDELIEKGLVEEIEESSYSYTLTTYGQLVLVMGFTTHEQTEKLEQNLSFHTPRRAKYITIVLLSIFIFLIFALLLLLFVSLDYLIIRRLHFSS